MMITTELWKSAGLPAVMKAIFSPAIYIGCMFGMLKLKDGRFRCWK